MPSILGAITDSSHLKQYQDQSAIMAEKGILDYDASKDIPSPNPFQTIVVYQI